MTRFTQWIVVVALCCSLSTAQAFVAPSEAQYGVSEGSRSRGVYSQVVERLIESPDIIDNAANIIFKTDGKCLSSLYEAAPDRQTQI